MRWPIVPCLAPALPTPNAMVQDATTDTRPEAHPEHVARWCEAVRTMAADELAAFERQTRRSYQHHSLIDFIREVVVRRHQLEREGWYRVRPSYQKPAGGFLVIGPTYRGDLVEDGAAVRFRHDPHSEWYETIPLEHLETNPEPRPPRRRRN